MDGYVWKNERKDGPMGWYHAYVGNTLMDCMEWLVRHKQYGEMVIRDDDIFLARLCLPEGIDRPTVYDIVLLAE